MVNESSLNFSFCSKLRIKLFNKISLNLFMHLARRNWQGSQKCYFGHENETIQHLFFDCRLSKMVWSMVHAAWGIRRPSSVANLFGGWLNGIPKQFKNLILVGAAALCWSVWLCRNAAVFENKHSSFLQVLYRTTHWLRTWATLQQPTSQEALVVASRFLEQVAKDIFSQAHGWRSSHRIDNH